MRFCRSTSGVQQIPLPTGLSISSRAGQNFHYPAIPFNYFSGICKNLANTWPAATRVLSRSGERTLGTRLEGHRHLSVFCRPQRIVGQKVSTNCRMAALPHCFPSSSCLLLREYWNLVPNNSNICVKKGHNYGGCPYLGRVVKIL